MSRCLSIALVLALMGCATSASQRPSSQTPAAVEARARAARSRRAAQAQTQDRLRELEAQLALTQAENAELHDAVRALRSEEQRRTTTIASRQCAPAPAPEEPPPVAEAASESRGGPRPVLRLYGSPSSARPAMNTAGVTAIPGPAAPAVVAPPPVGGARLPVFAAGATPDAVPAIPIAPVAVAGQPPSSPPAAELVRPADHDRAVRQYRSALRSLAERRLNDAMIGLDAFVREHPRHPYADNAMYWRAEILFTRHEYRRALAAFSTMIERYPRGNKVPDALLRIALCYERTGRRGRARRVFERLRAQYPESTAARMAAREDA